MGVCSYSVGSSCTSLLRRGVSHNSIWKQWFKFQPTMTNDMLGPLAKIIKTKTDAMLAHILIANSPQLLISFLYMLYNSILTRQLVADEWVRFLRPEGKRALRVSSLEGVQRSSYFLSLPLKYSIPLMVSSIALHSLASQSLFLVQTSAFGPGKDGERQPYFDYSSRGYSILASTIAISLALFLVILLILHSLYRNHSDIPANFQRMGLNSMALEAVCQTPVGDRDARFFPISLGIVSDVGNQDQRLVFSTDIHLHPPQQGQDYLQPIFVSRSWKGA